MPTQGWQLHREDAVKRRQILVAAMAQAAAVGVHCQGCSGPCCTFVANSMQITPLEAWDLWQFLVAAGRWDAALATQLQETVAQYGLARMPPSDGRRQFGRRTYTCPFFRGSVAGCSISRQAKPYGCLGFNSTEAGATEGRSCRSQQDLLAQQEAAHQDTEARNRALAERWSWPAPKLALPYGLLLVMAAEGGLAGERP